MKLKSVYVRFFRSFNYDYLRKTSSAPPTPKPWESIEDKWYPHVRVQLDENITPVVGENESGKSCLLEAVECAITGENIEHSDFCRHSQFFTVEPGRLHLPQFGCEWGELTPDEADKITGLCSESAEGARPSRFWLFRTESGETHIFLSDEKDALPTVVADDALSKILPTVFRINAKLALPESVPIAYLCGPRCESAKYTDWPSRSREIERVRGVISRQPNLFADEATIQQHATEIRAIAQETSQPDPKRPIAPKELELAHDLIFGIAGIDVDGMKKLYRALLEKKDVYAGALVVAMNERLEKKLNFRRFWAQDGAFELAVSLRNHELVFVVRDRTNREYSVQERSEGLRYFLSYYIQHLAHVPPDGAENEILLMDEPDAFLSRQGQQDLLKILDEFAFPRREDRKPVQVVYVTHSPFLLDKNNTQCIRVLEKGNDHEGTRVVRNASRNHYEPLRSAFGAFFAETTFIGNCNVMVEGLSDQVLLAGASRHLWSKREVPRSTTLDLNDITIVQAGGAQEIPYLVYLARGRDVDRPLVLVLLDSDAEGNRAKEVLLKGVAVHRRRKPLLEDVHILQIGEACAGAETIEDLVPPELAVAAAKRYLADYLGWDNTQMKGINGPALRKRMVEEGASLFEALSALVRSRDEAIRIEKVGFARSVIAVISTDRRPRGIKTFESRMQALLGQLNHMARQAKNKRQRKRIRNRVKFWKDQFLSDFPGRAAKDDALQLFSNIRDALDDSREAEAVGRRLAALAKEHELRDDGLSRDIDNYPQFREDLEKLQYAGMQEVQV